MWKSLVMLLLGLVVGVSGTFKYYNKLQPQVDNTHDKVVGKINRAQEITVEEAKRFLECLGANTK